MLCQFFLCVLTLCVWADRFRLGQWMTSSGARRWRTRRCQSLGLVLQWAL